MQTGSGEEDCFDGEGVIFSTLDKFRCLGKLEVYRESKDHKVSGCKFSLPFRSQLIKSQSFQQS